MTRKNSFSRLIGRTKSRWRKFTRTKRILWIRERNSATISNLASKTKARRNLLTANRTKAKRQKSVISDLNSMENDFLFARRTLNLRGRSSRSRRETLNRLCANKKSSSIGFAVGVLIRRCFLFVFNRKFDDFSLRSRPSDRSAFSKVENVSI